MIDDGARCPCGTGLVYGECCGRWHRGEAAPTAEALMRSRYCAFALGLVDYLLASWHPQARPQQLELDASIQWRRLDILRTEAGGPFDCEGVVEFEARYRSLEGRGAQHEVSRFTREGGRWFYLGEA
ncbi:YchJ family protein [Gulosibacter chungangensis]|uniref:UPF0225 protein F8O05_06200 n=1 Tax=Gulosibacter chungangensis TaxID=979746 RepID=A0A7J5BBJ4_9MICO|nr:YchJ family protein [Gulosibacter chungangensis]KAB1643476.1 YchJ family protein [Gulosibacter chungangensis]